MADLETLAAVEEIKKLKARYFRLVDTREWEQMAALFTPEIEVELETPDGPISLQGAAQFIDVIRSGLAGCISVHHGHMPEIEIHLPDRASGVWAMEDRLEWPASGLAPVRRLHGFGHYRETYLKDAGRAGSYVGPSGQWRIETLKLTRLRVDTGG